MPVGPPSHRRVRLGAALRTAREKRELSQDAAGKAMASPRPQTWINKIETAQIVRIKMGDLDNLMAVVGIQGDEAEQLRAFAKAPYGELGVFQETRASANWWETHQTVEVAARVIKGARLNAIDALLQTEKYMRLQIELAGGLNIESTVPPHRGSVGGGPR